MRTGGYTFQQSLTSESASIVKQAVHLARRRGHAQVTPLHVASAMLSSSTGLLKRACLQSHSHPLQCKALELCFNVALNRLPTSVSSPILGPHSHLPSLSNALVAAFKRAQAHQRRGSIDNQQQPILALKVEIEQLVISILDDPSISRVMREAGFSSTQVKNNVEQVVSSMEICSKEIINPKPLVLGNTNMSQITSSAASHVLNLSLSKAGHQVIRNDDVMSVVESMMNSKKRRNTVVIGECLATAEGVVRGVIDKFDKGEVQGDMKHVQFISVPLFTLRNVSREEFEIKLRELRTLVKNYMNRGVVLYLGDLRWVSEFWAKYGEQQRNISYYSPVEHMIMELSRLLNSAMGENGRVWLIGIASFQTYTKCKTGHPSLQTLWDLYPLTIPVGNLGLSLNLASDLHSHFRNKAAMDGSSWSLGRAGVEKQLNCCADCLANFNREAKTFNSIQVKTESTTTYSSSSLPLWLQKYKEEHRQENNQQESEVMIDLCKKWNSICSSVHKQQPHFLEKGLISPLSSSPSPCSSNSISYANDHMMKSSTKLHKSLLNWPVIFEPNQSPKEHQFFISDQNEVSTKPELLSNPNSSPNSASSSEASGYMENIDRFMEFNSENMKVLCKALEKKVPWQKDIIPEIVSTILECRSKKEESWLFFLGADSEGKEKISRELAKIAFGSSEDHSFVSIGLSSFSSSSKSDTTDHQEVISNKKRSRDEHGRSYLERFADAVQENSSRVFFMEDIDQVDSFSQKGIKKSIETGSLTTHDGDLVSFKDAIIIFSSESLSSVTKKCDDDQDSKEKNQENIGDHDESSAPPSTILDLNVATHEELANGDENLVGIWEAVDKQVMFKIQVL